MVRATDRDQRDGPVLLQAFQRAALDVHCGEVGEGSLDEVLDCRPEFVGD